MDPAAAPRRPWTSWSSVAAHVSALGFPGAIAPWLPRDHWLCDLPASFAPQSSAILLLGAVLLALTRRFRLAALWFAGVGAGAAVVVPAWWQASAAQADGPAALRLLAINIERGGEANDQALLATIAAAQPDVVLLSEVTPAWWDRIAPALAKTFPHHHERPDPGWFGIALWSRYPLHGAAAFGLPYEWAPAIRAVVDAPGGPLGVLGVHLPRPGMDGRCAQRDAALAAIPAALEPLPARRVVFGDCNATPYNRGFRDLLATTGLCDAGGAGFAPTWPTHWPWPFRVPIDHVLLGGGLRAVETRVLPPFGSDHCPLFAAVR